MIRRNIGWVSRKAGQFRHHRRGNVAVIFSLCLIPVFGLIGAAVDYARAAKAKAQLQIAVDAAAIAAVQQIGADYAARQNAAYGAIEANLATSALDSVTVTVSDNFTSAAKAVSVDATGVLPTSIIKVVGINTVDIGAKAEAVGGGSPTEIALVLDNTGSMVNDMTSLKLAARNFVNTVFAGGSTNVKMSVVPYVATVNVGSNFPPAALELTGTSGYQGAIYRGAWLALNTVCQLNPPPPTTTTIPTPTTPSPPPPPIGDPSGKDKTASLDAPFSPYWRSAGQKAREFAQNLFGVSRAAADVTANSIDPIQTYNYALTPPNYPSGLPAIQIPVGYDLYGCTLWHNGPISNLELFNRMSGVAWKGCVEARGAPYDVTDDPPNATDVNSHFVPYFAPDEPDGPTAPSFRNNYLSDVHASWASGTSIPGWTNWDSLHTMFKYDMVNVPKIVETPPVTSGPNANCPDPLLRLTNDQAAILAKINSLNYWAGGGTISSEGLVWGWRTISPNAPFADGSSYTAPSGAAAVKKHIVLMTDGLNSLVDNRPSGAETVLSDYTAYGYLTQGRLGGYPATFLKAETFLNERMLTACANAKAKGVSIYTILFRETDATTKELLKSCATTPSQALQANDEASLQAAFQSIASQISSIRLAK